MTDFDKDKDIITYNSDNVPYNNNTALAPNNYQANALAQPEPQAGGSDFIPKMISKWPVIIIVFIIMAGITVPGVWLFTQKSYKAQILIEVAPMTEIILSDPDNSAKTFSYDSFKNTQAKIMLSEQIIQRAADIIRDRPLYMFTPREETLKGKLKQVWQYKDFQFLTDAPNDRYKVIMDMAREGKITAVSDKYSDFIYLSIESRSASDAKTIIEAIRQSYIEQVLFKMEGEGDKKIAQLEKELNTISSDLSLRQDNIFQLTVQYGYADLSKRHEMIIDRMVGIQEQLSKAESEKADLDNLVKKLENSIDAPVELPEISEKTKTEQLSQYINADERLKKLSETLITEEQKLMFAQQTLTPENPEIARQKSTIETLNAKVEERRALLKEEFENLQDSDRELKKQDALASRQSELDQAKAVFENQVVYIQNLREQLESSNQEAIDIGRLDTQIKRRQEEYSQKENVQKDIQDKILKLRIENNRQSRITADRPVSVIDMPDKKIKLAGGAAFGSLAAGLAVAFLLVKMDKSILYPEDILRQAGTAIIGTTVNISSVKKKDIVSYLNMDYQNIRANLKLMNNGVIPQTLVISSAEPGEGKTTLSINLAASLARSGHRVLLVDGDLRKPDIHRIVNLPDRTVGLREVASGICIFEDAVFEDYHPNLDVLRACGSTNFDSVQLLSGRGIIEFLEQMTGKYDHIIIDTSPILAAPDALLWARLADAVVMSSLSGTTTSSSLKTALERLAKINAKVIGNVLANVSDRPGYGYGHNYYDYRYGKADKAHGKKKYKNLILSNDNSLKS